MTEWDHVSCLTIVEIDDNRIEEPIIGEGCINNGFVNTKDVLNAILQFENGNVLPLNDHSSSFSECIHLCCPFLSRKVFTSKQNIEKSTLIRIAGEQFENNNEFHLKCLFTIYSKLTGDIVKGQRRFGSHWEEIGFQGSDPATDFRGVGLLGLFQLCNFVIDPESSALALDIYQLSLNQTQHFPFAVMSINITQISLQTLKKSYLNRAIIESNSSVYTIFHQFYILTFQKFYFRWKMENKTITDTGYVLQDLRENSKKNSRELFHNIKSNKPKSTKSTVYMKEEIEFSNIGTILD